MPVLGNLTPFAAADFLSLTREGEECLVLVVAGSFAMPRPGRPSTETLPLCDEQLAPHETDVYWGEPGTSSLRYETQAVYTRPMTDVLLHGHAWAPRGRRVGVTQVSVRVGPLQKRAVVSGTRVWQRGVVRVVPSDPLPFESLPLRYEHGFGGTAGTQYETRNPVGVGFYESERKALDNPLPSIEEPQAMIRSWSDRPEPCGFGPVARNWQPRLGFAGTYDAAWVERRAPLWPADFDERFFQVAPAGLRATPHLRGGEPVVLEGVSPDGPIAFPLPTYRVVARCHFARRVERRLMTLDTVYLEPDDRRLVLIWRATFPAHRELATHVKSSVRLLEPWEDAP
ncbi:hypothetical protein ATI61_1275 [Archangium gephyra]|uniref:DUF2169 domain-containing protein n=1 Tax=Archangium gephyra TaxID=48 RepID=A0ABX9JKC4_9BACT|nr:DUF2169 domain-containing protein [Archangium gephyra]REG14286.1 hypothetical protein ATI61_1275 [Archangium gephyra]